jgi:lipid A 3-O-deacylase
VALGITGRLVLGLAAGFAASAALAGTKTYDVNVLMHQPHPFASAQPVPAYVPAPAMQVRQPARVPTPAASPFWPRPAAAPTVSERRPPVMAQPSGQVVGLHQRREGWREVFSEVRVGFLMHDVGPFSSNEEDGYDGNFELLFVSPRFLDIIWSPRPHLGFTVNSAGNTNQAYFGLTWEWSFWGNWFAGFSFGGSVHNGELTTVRTDRKELGCHLLFRESVEGGYRFGSRHAVSLFLDHISNGNICDKNEGLENWGVRYGYRF